ncbi:hypothetical protein GMLC_09080 [Geomonas limicola]|uniref:BIG2 domain-containing protein n=1 Tax=Geomonas limicola TaxID=2740186 RepID=A0A6V8N7Q2_9BACT|nr:YncE family protein [Geomonas limicola]GFO67329.1 hypothetical protein GMLC_09080 [Geomonas limicola]
MSTFCRALLLVVFLLSGCGGGSSHPATLVSVSVLPTAPSLAPGTTLQLYASAQYSDGSAVDVTSTANWSSGTSSVATVNQGLATGVAAGQSLITASLGTLSSVPVTLTVSPLQSIDITPVTPGVLVAGSRLQFSATGHLGNGTTQNLTSQVSWQSSNTGVATIAAGGMATGVGAGPTQISGSFGGVTGGPVSLTVATLQSISVSPATWTALSGDQQQFSATGLLSNGDTPDLTTLVTWSSTPSTVASISNVAGSRGRATAAAGGSASVTASYNGVLSTPAAVTVQGPSSITVTPVTPSAVSGTTLQFTATGSFDNNADRDVTAVATWTSSVPSAASFNNVSGPRGLASIGSSGTTFVRATLGSVSDETTLSVKALRSLAITPSPATVPRGTSAPLTLTGTFSDSSTEDLTSSATWVSGTPSIAQVGNAPETKGTVLGVANGTATITATVGTLSTKVTVLVQTVVPTTPADKAYLVSSGLNALQVLDTSTNQITGTPITVGTAPQGVALNTSTNKAYVTNSGSGTVSVVDLTTNTTVKTIPVRNAPWGIALAPSTSRAYVANKFSGNLSVINTDTDSVVATIPVGTSPEGVAANASGSRIYVANSGSNTVSVINGSNLVIATIPTTLSASGPNNIALNGNFAYVTCSNSNNVLVINTSTNTVTGTISAGSNPQGIAIDSAANRAYVANNGSNTVSVLNTSTNTPAGTISVSGGPMAVAVRPSTGRYYVVNNSGSTVTVFNTSNNGLVAGAQTAAGPVAIAVLP